MTILIEFLESKGYKINEVSKSLISSRAKGISDFSGESIKNLFSQHNIVQIWNELFS